LPFGRAINLGANGPRSRHIATVAAEAFGLASAPYRTTFFASTDADRKDDGAMAEDVRIAEVAALVGDPARANILTALMGGQALTAGELVLVTGVSPQTTSGHLGKLAGGRLIACVKQGRHRYYRIATPRIAEMLEGIMAVVADSPPRHRPTSKLDEAMRVARTCYDHFAGKLGVGITDALCALGHVTLSDQGGEVSDSGVGFFKEFGVDLDTARGRRRIFCRPCLDWTERRPHLGGSVGAVLAQRCFDLGWLARVPNSRALTITKSGRRGLNDTFGVSL
jgi:DNA-binding transcriptional ArsR family regulator